MCLLAAYDCPRLLFFQHVQPSGLPNHRTEAGQIDLMDFSPNSPAITNLKSPFGFAAKMFYDIYLQPLSCAAYKIEYKVLTFSTWPVDVIGIYLQSQGQSIWCIDNPPTERNINEYVDCCVMNYDFVVE